jgi:hypothetical protein
MIIFQTIVKVTQVISAKYIIRVSFHVDFYFLDRGFELIECIQVYDAQIFVRFRTGGIQLFGLL